jgi:hypothetical protein
VAAKTRSRVARQQVEQQAVTSAAQCIYCFVWRGCPCRGQDWHRSQGTQCIAVSMYALLLCKQHMHDCGPLL